MSDKGYKKKYDVAKTIKQCFLVLLELGIVCFLVIFITSKAMLCKNVLEYLERATLGVAVYEFIIYVTLKFINDAKLDEYNAIRTAYRKAILAVRSNDNILFLDVNESVSKQLDHSIMNSVSIRKEYTILKDLMNDHNLISLEYRLINIEHLINTTELSWNYTLLLRWFK